MGPAALYYPMYLAFNWLSFAFASAADGVDDADDEEEAEDEKPKTRKEKQQVWDLVNDNKAIWLRKPSEVTPDEYQKFYKAVSKVCVSINSQARYAPILPCPFSPTASTPGPSWTPQNFDEPLAYSHFKAEGDIEFKSVLFIPSTSPHDFYDKYYDKAVTSSIKLYVRRVFISDEIPDLIPK